MVSLEKIIYISVLYIVEKRHLRSGEIRLSYNGDSKVSFYECFSCIFREILLCSK